MAAVEQMYGGPDFYATTAIVTMAPELDPDGQVGRKRLCNRKLNPFVRGGESVDGKK